MRCGFGTCGLMIHTSGHSHGSLRIHRGDAPERVAALDDVMLGRARVDHGTRPGLGSDRRGPRTRQRRWPPPSRSSPQPRAQQSLRRRRPSQRTRARARLGRVCASHKERRTGPRSPRRRELQVLDLRPSSTPQLREADRTCARDSRLLYWHGARPAHDLMSTLCAGSRAARAPISDQHHGTANHPRISRSRGCAPGPGP